MAAVGATSGSISAVLLRLLTEGLSSTASGPFQDCPICPECVLSDFLGSPVWEHIDPLSLGLGVLLGLLLGPILDLFFLARQAWKAWIKSSLAVLAKKQKAEHLYRFA